MFSYWERTEFIGKPDVVIIGSGIVGLSSALSLKERAKDLNILVLERGMLPYGASTRNAGFACYGSASELLEDLQTQTEDQVFSLVESRWKGLQRLRQRIGDAEMELETHGGYELFDSRQEQVFRACVDKLDTLNRRLKEITGIAGMYHQADDMIGKFQFKNVNHLILNKAESQINTGKLMNALVKLCDENNIRIMNGAKVSRIEPIENGINVFLDDDVIHAGSVLIATNGFAKQFLPAEDVNPARAQVLITKPIDGLRLEGTFHYDHGYYYFRNVGNRVLFGGGRNLDFDGESTEHFGLTLLIQNKLDDMLQNMILPGVPYEVDMRWSGIMGLGKTKKPIVAKVAPHLFCAVRMGGMGVAIGSLVGDEAAELILNERS